MTKTRPIRGGIFLPALLCTALWGSAIPAVKAGYDLFSIAGEDAAAKLFFAGMRFTIAGLLVLALVLVRRETVPQKRRMAGDSCAVGGADGDAVSVSVSGTRQHNRGARLGFERNLHLFCGFCRTFCLQRRPYESA